MEQRLNHRILLFDPGAKNLEKIESQIQGVPARITLLLCMSSQDIYTCIDKEVSLVIVTDADEALGLLDVIRERTGGKPVLLFDPYEDYEESNNTGSFDLVVGSDTVHFMGWYIKKWIVSRKQGVLSPSFPLDLDETTIFYHCIRSPNMIAAVFMPDSRIVFANPGFCRITGYAEHEIAGKSLRNDLVPAKIRGQIDQYFQRMKTGFSVPVMETVCRTRNGEEVAVKWSNTIHFDSEGSTQYVFSIGRDVTQLLKAKHESIQSVRFLERILDSMDADVFVLNRKYQIVRTNTRFRERYSPGTHVSGRNCYQVVYNYDRPCHAMKLPCPLQHVMSTYENYRGETGDLNQDGQVWEVSGTPVLNERGGIENIVVLLTDITSKKRIEDALTRDIEEKRVMLKEIHHRVNNNMQIISSLIEFEVRKISDTTAQARVLRLKDRIRTMAMIHNQVYYSPELSEIDMGNLVRQAVSTAGRRNTDNTIPVSVEPLSDPKTIPVGKAIPLGLILYELLSNSFEHAFPVCFNGSKSITITMQCNEKTIKISIQDSGVGISDRKGAATSRTGGLYLARILAEDQLEGSLMIAVEKGTKCTLVFPGVDSSGGIP